MTPRHEPEVIQVMATQLADEVATWLIDLGFTGEEVASMARAAEIDALDYCLKP